MTRWLLDPVARFAAQRSAVWAVIAPVGFVAFGTVGAGFDAELLGITGLACLIFALPHTVAKLVEWDRGGQLDHLRLTGLPPHRLTVGLLGAATPWIAVGALLTLAWIGVKGPRPVQLVAIGAVLGIVVAVSALVLALARPRHADSRIVGAGLAVIGVAGGLAAIGATQDGTEAIQIGSGIRIDFGGGTAAWILVVFEAIAVAVCVPWVVAAMARPARAASIGPRWDGLAPLRRQGPPAFRRAMASYASSAITVAIVVAVSMAVCLLYRDSSAMTLVAQTLAYFPLGAGAALLASRSRSDEDTGRLDVLRGAPTPAWRMAAANIAASWFPFVLTSAVLHLAVYVVWGLPPLAPLEASLVLVLIAPLAMLEGWHRWLLLGYTAPAVIACIPMLSAARISSKIPLLIVGWIPWMLAAQTLRLGPGTALPARWAALALAALVTVGYPPRAAEPPFLAALLLCVSGWIGGREGGHHAGARAALVGVVFGVGTALAVLAGTLWPPAYNALVGLTPAAALWIGLRLHARFDDRPVVSLALRLALAIVTAGISPTVVAMAYGSRPGLLTGNQAAYLIAHTAITAGVMIVAGLIVEGALRLSPRRVIPRP